MTMSREWCFILRGLLYICANTLKDTFHGADLDNVTTVLLPRSYRSKTGVESETDRAVMHVMLLEPEATLTTRRISLCFLVCVRASQTKESQAVAKPQETTLTEWSLTIMARIVASKSDNPQ